MFTRRQFVAAPLLAALPALRGALGQEAKAKLKAARRPDGGDRDRPVRGQGMAVFDAVMHAVLDQYRIAGGTLGVAKDGRLVHARGYGWADVAAGTPVRPDTLFSLASVTKPVTGVAILKLVDDGRLKLDARVVDLLRPLDPPPGVRVADPRFRDMTVRHLLLHAGGWSHGQNFARVAARAAARAADSEDSGVDEAATADGYRRALGRPLDFAPGTDHHYSNFGFLVLRLILEAVTGEPYEPFVTTTVLRPMGAIRMRMEPPEYLPDETRRYQAGGRILAERSANNWLATPTSFCKFLTALDGTRGRPFLSAPTIRAMLAPPPPPIKVNPNGSHPGLGWDVVRPSPAGVTYAKNGGKAGVLAWAEHLPGGVNWVVQFNTSKPADVPGSPLAAAQRRFTAALAEVRSWPPRDLFERPA